MKNAKLRQTPAKTPLEQSNGSRIFGTDLVIARDGREALDYLQAAERAGTLPVLILLPVIIMTSSRDDDQLMAAVKKLGLYWSVNNPPEPPPTPGARSGRHARAAA